MLSYLYNDDHDCTLQNAIEAAEFIVAACCSHYAPLEKRRPAFF
jgi:hypothetical protein